jgi:hypothetical protein
VSGAWAGNHPAQDPVPRTLGKGRRHRPRGFARCDDDQPAIAKRIQVTPRYVRRQQGEWIDGSNAASDNEADVVAKPGEGDNQ